jgi:hypothetical protein
MLTELDPDQTLIAAAHYLAGPRQRTGTAIVPDLKTRYGITTVQAIEAIRLANKIREATYVRAS